VTNESVGGFEAVPPGNIVSGTNAFDENLRVKNFFPPRFLFPFFLSLLFFFAPLPWELEDIAEFFAGVIDRNLNLSLAKAVHSRFIRPREKLRDDNADPLCRG